MNAAATDAAKCTASGDGLSKAQAGISAAFHIKAVDCYGNRRNSGAFHCTILLYAASGDHMQGVLMLVSAT